MSNEYKDWTIENYKEEITRLIQQRYDLIEAQNRRIKELEAAFNQVNHNRESVDALKNQLAALRKRIDDAPVVAWEKFGKERALISKEDLQG